MSKTMRELNIDTDKNPLGRLAGDQITKGYKVLKEIQNHLKSERCKEQTIIDLSNLFYTNIPQSYGMKKVPMIDSMARLREKIILLDILKEFETANKYLNIAISE
jgi:poly [ADP-ribose] polymerase